MRKVYVILILLLPLGVLCQKHFIHASYNFSALGMMTGFKGNSLELQYEYEAMPKLSIFATLGIGNGSNDIKPFLNQEGESYTLIFHRWQEYIAPGWAQNIREVNRGNIIRTPNLSSYSEFIQDLGFKFTFPLGNFDIGLSGGFTFITVDTHFILESNSGELRLTGMQEALPVTHHTAVYLSYWDWGNTVALDMNYKITEKVSFGPQVKLRGFYKSIHNFYIGTGFRLNL